MSAVADAAAAALAACLPPAGSTHVYDLLRWWESGGYEKLHGDLDTFITAHPTVFDYSRGLVSRCASSSAQQAAAAGDDPSAATSSRVHLDRLHRQRRESEWNDVRQDLQATSQRLHHAALACPPSSASFASSLRAGPSAAAAATAASGTPRQQPQPQPQPQPHRSSPSPALFCDAAPPPPASTPEPSPPRQWAADRRGEEKPATAQQPPAAAAAAALDVGVSAAISQVSRHHDRRHHTHKLREQASRSSSRSQSPPPRAGATPAAPATPQDAVLRLPGRLPEGPPLAASRILLGATPTAAPAAAAAASAPEQHLAPAIRHGVTVAATAGVLASLRMLVDRTPSDPAASARDVVQCALESAAELVGREALARELRAWLDDPQAAPPLQPLPSARLTESDEQARAAQPPVEHGAVVSLPYTPHAEYSGVAAFLRGRCGGEGLAGCGAATVAASSVLLGCVDDFAASGPRPFRTCAEKQPWAGVEFASVRVRPTHYTLGYHPGAGVPPPTSWELEALDEASGGWVVLAAHAADASFLPGATEVVASFMLQPATGYHRAFRVVLPRTSMPVAATEMVTDAVDQSLPFSGFEVYGDVVAAV